MTAVGDFVTNRCFTFLSACGKLMLQKVFADLEGETLTGKGCHRVQPAREGRVL